MAKFPLKVTYAVLTTVELGLRHGPASIPTQAKAIAHNQSIPSRFIEQILSALKQAGLVTSLRGAQGGYRLSKEPAETSLADIVEAVSGSTSPSNEITNGHKETGNLHEELLSGIWQRLQDAELAILRSISLQSLVDQYQKLEEKRVVMYHI